MIRIASTWDGTPLPDGAVATVEARLHDGRLHLRIDAPFHDDPPPPHAPGPTPKLWEHEVVELFVLGPGERYTEIEVGPHGHHLVLRLEGVRRAVASGLPLEVRGLARDGGRWQAEAVLDAALLPPRPWRLNAYRIHGVGAARRYLAFQPAPGPAPDFHRLEAFVDAEGWLEG